MKTVVGFVLLAAIVGGVYGLNAVTRTEDGKSILHVAKELEVPVQVTVPEQRAIVRTVQAPGVVEAFSEVDISAEVAGKVIEMAVEEGDAVRKGDLLCRLDDAYYRARVLSAQANVARLDASILQAQADLEKAERDARRQVRLSEADATSALELADYHTAHVRAEASVEIRKQELISAKASLESAKEDLAKTVITAPIDGTVSQLFAEEGEVVITGTMNNPGTRIMVVSDLSKMQVRCRVDEGDAALVTEEQAARIYLQSDTQRGVAGHVFRIATKGTTQAGRDVVSFETLVLVDSDDARVKPGMTASVEIEVARSKNALTIPVQAVVNRKRKDLPKALVEEYDRLQSRIASDRRHGGAEYIPVLFVSEDEVARPRLVETGINDDRSVEIVAGVKAGERVVTGPYRSLDKLKDGSRLKIENAEDEGEEKVATDKAPEGDADPKEAQASAG